MDMREKIARAMFLNSHLITPPPNAWEDAHPQTRNMFFRHATAALTALEEPTPEMVESAQWKAEDEGFLYFDPGDFSMAFSAAIHAAKGGSDA